MTVVMGMRMLVFVLAVVMSMVVVMSMIVVRVRVMLMAVHMAIAMFVPIVQIRFAVCMWILVEDQGLDGHRHCVRRHSDATQINEIKAPEGHPVDHQNLTFNAIVFLKNMA